jgi:hypothetical protein
MMEEKNTALPANQTENITENLLKAFRRVLPDGLEGNPFVIVGAHAGEDVVSKCLCKCGVSMNCSGSGSGAQK